MLEAPGDADNPVILAWAAEVGEQTVAIHRSDAVPWCGLFMAVVALRAHKPLPAIPSRAISWATFGQPCSTPMLGDTLVFQRTGGGHVGLYIGEDERAYHVLGGNQSDAYRKAYPTSTSWKDKTVHEKASAFFADGKVLARLEELRAEHRERHEVTVDRIIEELACSAFFDPGQARCRHKRTASLPPCRSPRRA